MGSRNTSLQHGTKPPQHGRPSTTSFMEKVAEEKCDDKENLLDVDLGLFSDTDSINDERREKEHPALYYTITLNWMNEK